MKKNIVSLALLYAFLPILAGAASVQDTAAIAEELFYLVNQERARAGLPALSTNALLASAAMRKATDMMARGYFEHTAPSGKEFFEWIDESGYAYSIAGENLAANFNTISPEAMVEAWMGSKLHRDNVLDERYSETGLGVVAGTFDGKPVLFVAEEFGHPKEGASPLPASQPAPTPAPVKITAKPSSVVATTTFPPHALEGATTTPTEVIAGVSVVASTTEIQPQQVVKKNFFQSLIGFFSSIFRPA